MHSRFSVCVQQSAGQWLACTDPELVLQADTHDAVRRTLVDVEQLTRDRGLHAVGFVSYEAGGAFGLKVRDLSGLPLVWFSLFDGSSVIQCAPPERTGGHSIGPLRPSIDRVAFGRAFREIKNHLAAGNTYQVNYTFQIVAPFGGDPWSLFADLTAAQGGRYGTYLDLGDQVVASASPELFFEFRGDEILARPMKGTARRGLTIRDDGAARDALRQSAKNQAENVMVVDMVRNDLGRLADVGTVRVPELFTVEKYPNVWQMTSLVTARSLAPLDEVFAALHPSASITGAPKVRTMELLSGLEGTSRGVYTGAIGHVPPDGLARFNVGIRTAVVDRRLGIVSFGVGSGIVWDSDEESEWEECLLKASVLVECPPPFDLVETLLWTPADGYGLLVRHLSRLSASADYFDRPFSDRAVRHALERAVSLATVPMRVRLLLDAAGAARTEARPHVASVQPLQIALAIQPVNRSTVWLYHKTTNRAVYEDARRSAPDADEVLLWNTEGELTEATTANLVVELDGTRVTPPVSSGLLAGTWRASMLERGEVREQVVRIDDLARAAGIWLINSVHGERRATLIDRQY
jgi:para-aminobenzoate synthetase/4-amino-4-deoxychorismate lyase